jgi:hypothetical protein
MFITSFGIFCYTNLAFRLKNGGATYQKGIHMDSDSRIEEKEVVVDANNPDKKLWISDNLDPK